MLPWVSGASGLGHGNKCVSLTTAYGPDVAGATFGRTVHWTVRDLQERRTSGITYPEVWQSSHGSECASPRATK
ncbi:hypothetical protein [Desulfitobacterium sp.]|uniref:hypothetical protein n=1 Tax=Desulfitobacterium sp. TaxID=49981 RepID=UPI002BFE7A33|nr:hypothetical protein [Desulfitobacterium sp.]HVJ48512.1 hypothetical protein [Desulfitobacterium sp.]